MNDIIHDLKAALSLLDRARDEGDAADFATLVSKSLDHIDRATTNLLNHWDAVEHLS